MMRVIIKDVEGDVEYSVYFKHFTPFETIGNPGTTCFIDKNRERHLIGEAFLSPKDQFSRKIGRRKSFERAVSLILNKETRKELWKAFLEAERIKTTNKKEVGSHQL
jgi:hypothetical protein